MTKMIRAIMALASFALTSALFGGSADVSVSSGTIDISIGGTTDGFISVVDIATNQTMITITADTYSIGWYGTSYRYGAFPVASGVGFSGNSITGLPAGDYRITANSYGFMSDFGAWSSGTYAEITLYSPYYSSEWMDFYFTAY